MGTHITWAHGNAVTVESPENLEPGGIHVGWGTDLTLGSGKGSWFHIPIPVPSLHDGDPVYLRRVFLLYRTAATTLLKSVHIYDGKRLLREFNDLGYDGDHTTNYEGPDTSFPLAERVRVRRGIGLSFFVQGSLGPVAGVPDIKATMDQDQQLKKSLITAYAGQADDAPADEAQTSVDGH